ncbi:hypothetical protein HMPREF9997_02205 [Corynebacterium durum F0235]|uniref:Uncharacterized protein n=1 Tax=Corynebacterium durum F0235 TaxID=1035195 RepID=L1MC54_9CORY|nr:hypothetical protein HMPREF9997_02205 [Corynebacterium durum F0235]
MGCHSTCCSHCDIWETSWCCGGCRRACGGAFEWRDAVVSATM